MAPPTNRSATELWVVNVNLTRLTRNRRRLKWLIGFVKQPPQMEGALRKILVIEVQEITARKVIKRGS
jgi:hypothetical protein